MKEKSWLLCPDSLLRLWRYIDHLLAYLLFQQQLIYL